MTNEYSLTLDIFSGAPNPVVQIEKEDFTKLYLEVFRLQNASPTSMFDGLGFRGFILAGLDEKIVAQKNILKIVVRGKATYKRAKPATMSQFIELFKKYNSDKSLNGLLDEITG
jgi:hypothetical protein